MTPVEIERQAVEALQDMQRWEAVIALGKEFSERASRRWQDAQAQLNRIVEEARHAAV